MEPVFEVQAVKLSRALATAAAPLRVWRSEYCVNMGRHSVMVDSLLLSEQTPGGAA
jgi:hypothetical protein